MLSRRSESVGWSTTGVKKVGTIASRSLNDAGRARLAELARDYEVLTGQTFESFYCPVLYRDEDVHLCRAHVIGRGFRDSDRGWTIQRKDVDSFYGSLFEADFLALQERKRHDPLHVLKTPHLNRQLRPKLSADGVVLEHFIPNGPVPVEYSRVQIGAGVETFQLALKLHPDDALDLLSSNWQIQIEKDVRLAALGSILKAAHLTLFYMLGYRYALSTGGHFLGWSILGEFFLKHGHRPRADLLGEAERHFPQFVNMVRPVLSAPEGHRGTLSDNRFYVCGAGKPWAMLVLVRTADTFHAVLVPVFEDPDSSAYFLDFLRNPTSDIAVRLAEWTGEEFKVAKNIGRFRWPPANYFSE